MMRPAISCATTIGGTRRSYSRSFRQTSRCASAFATFLSEVRRWSRSMDEARPITTTRRRIAGWLRAIRGIAGTYNAVQAQAPELQELRRGVEGLARSHREMISQNTAKLDATAKQVADAREQISKMLDGMKDVVAAQHAFTAAQETVRATQESVATALQTLSASQQELHRSVDDVRNTQNALRSCQEQLGEKYARLAPTMPQLALAGGRDPATWLYAAFEE